MIHICIYCTAPITGMCHTINTNILNAAKKHRNLIIDPKEDLIHGDCLVKCNAISNATNTAARQTQSDTKVSDAAPVLTKRNRDVLGSNQPLSVAASSTMLSTPNTAVNATSDTAADTTTTAPLNSIAAAPLQVQVSAGKQNGAGTLLPTVSAPSTTDPKSEAVSTASDILNPKSITGDPSKSSKLVSTSKTTKTATSKGKRAASNIKPGFTLIVPTSEWSCIRCSFLNRPLWLTCNGCKLPKSLNNPSLPAISSSTDGSKPNNNNKNNISTSSATAFDKTPTTTAPFTVLVPPESITAVASNISGETAVLNKPTPPTSPPANKRLLYIPHIATPSSERNIPGPPPNTSTASNSSQAPTDRHTPAAAVAASKASVSSSPLIEATTTTVDVANNEVSVSASPVIEPTTATTTRAAVSPITAHLPSEQVLTPLTIGPIAAGIIVPNAQIKSTTLIVTPTSPTTIATHPLGLNYVTIGQFKIYVEILYNHPSDAEASPVAKYVSYELPIRASEAVAKFKSKSFKRLKKGLVPLTLNEEAKSFALQFVKSKSEKLVLLISSLGKYQFNRTYWGKDLADSNYQEGYSKNINHCNEWINMRIFVTLFLLHYSRLRLISPILESIDHSLSNIWEYYQYKFSGAGNIVYTDGNHTPLALVKFDLNEISCYKSATTVSAIKPKSLYESFLSSKHAAGLFRVSQYFAKYENFCYDDIYLWMLRSSLAAFYCNPAIVSSTASIIIETVKLSNAAHHYNPTPCRILKSIPITINATAVLYAAQAYFHDLVDPDNKPSSNDGSVASPSEMKLESSNEPSNTAHKVVTHRAATNTSFETALNMPLNSSSITTSKRKDPSSTSTCGQPSPEKQRR